ncbi:molybdopterin-dependent oxidoreductase [Methanobrevibacter sp.]|uniref:molybdopterin-dependent oxidoreductase n=1 Tax=Methanobrevibacter sp. TaxID=66852 RepID=UPI00386DAED2
MLEIKHTLCPSCSVGCGINVILDDEAVVGSFPYKRHPVNEGKNCANGRKSIENFANKINEASISGGAVELIKAINEISKEIDASDKVTVVLSGNNSLKEAEAIKSFIDENNFSLLFYADDLRNFDEVASYEEIEKASSVLVIGDILYENPLIGRRIVHAKQNGAKIFSNIKAEKSVTANISDETTSVSVQEFLNNYKDNLDESSVIVFNTVDSSDDLDKIEELGSKILPVYSKTNTKGVLNIADPNSKDEVLELLANTKVLLVFNDDILNEFDFDFKSISIIISLSAFENDTTKASDVVVPVKSWLEYEGSFVNAMGESQNFSQVMESDALSIVEVIEKIKG